MIRDNDSLPFSHERDAELAAALAAALEAEDHAAFTARVLAGFDAARAPAPSWDTELSRWARVGVAAALVAVIAGYLMSQTARPAAAEPPTVEEAIVAPPVADAIVVAAFLNR
jgi:hypothetical protein